VISQFQPRGQVSTTGTGTSVDLRNVNCFVYLVVVALSPDGLGNLRKVTDNVNNNTIYTLDGNGNVTKVEHKDGDTVHSEYELAYDELGAKPKYIPEI